MVLSSMLTYKLPFFLYLILKHTCLDSPSKDKGKIACAPVEAHLLQLLGTKGDARGGTRKAISEGDIRTLKMISEATSCFPQNPQDYQMHDGMKDIVSSTSGSVSGVDSHSQTLLYNLSVLREKVQEVQSLVSVVVSSNQIHQESVAVAIANAGPLIQEIIIAASSMMYAFQQLAIGSVALSSSHELSHHHMKPPYEGPSQPNTEAMDQVLHNLDNSRNRSFFGGASHNNKNIISPVIAITNGDGYKKPESHPNIEKIKGLQDFSLDCDIIELDAADLLAKYTHYCQVCGKGFKRDANLRMHMRAHGDEYKTNAALSNPTKSGSTNGMGEELTVMGGSRRKYSCPQEGCRWNRKHAKFQPLKSMICVKNHYKRSHCPKMYVCNRCSCKQFSVLSDLRTHEKHCGYVKWQCSCGTTFSRKDKLMGHVSLFVGHSPVINCFVKQGVQEYSGIQNGLDGR